MSSYHYHWHIDERLVVIEYWSTLSQQDLKLGCDKYEGTLAAILGRYDFIGPVRSTFIST
jgi:hypothetical protein